MFHQIQRGFNLVEYVLQLAREMIVHPVQNRHYTSCARETHPCGGPTVIGLTRRQVPVPWGAKSITNSLRYNAQHDKVSAIALTGLSRSATSVRSPCELGRESPEAIAPSALGHHLRIPLGTTLVSLVRSRVVAELERWGCPILYSLVPKIPGKSQKVQDVVFRGWNFSAFPENKIGKELKLLKDTPR